SLVPGEQLEATVTPPPKGAPPEATVALRPLPPPADPRAAVVRALTTQLAPELGETRAAAIAEFVAARGVPEGDAPLLAARLVAQQASPVEKLREAVAGRPDAKALLHAIEHDLTSGDRDRVRAAVSKLGLDQERRLATRELTEASTLKSLAGPKGETAVSAQQV